MVGGHAPSAREGCTRLTELIAVDWVSAVHSALAAERFAQPWIVLVLWHFTIAGDDVE